MVSAGVDSGQGDSDMVFHTLGLCDINTIWSIKKPQSYGD